MPMSPCGPETPLGPLSPCGELSSEIWMIQHCHQVYQMWNEMRNNDQLYIFFLTLYTLHCNIFGNVFCFLWHLLFHYYNTKLCTASYLAKPASNNWRTVEMINEFTISTETSIIGLPSPYASLYRKHTQRYKTQLRPRIYTKYCVYAFKSSLQILQ